MTHFSLILLNPESIIEKFVKKTNIQKLEIISTNS